MVCNRRTITVEEILYYLLFSIIIFTKGVGLDEGSVLFRVCLLIGSCFLGTKFIIGKYSLAEIVVAGLLGIWGVINFKISGSLAMYIYIVLIVGMKNVPVKRVFQVGAVVWGICMLFSATAAVFAGRTGVRIVHEKLGMGPLLRESLGYAHPNVLHVTYVVLMAFVLYLCSQQRGKKLARTIFLLLLGDFYIFIYSLSYTGILFSFAYLVAFFYFTYRSRMSKIETVLIQCIVPMFLVVSIAFPMLVEYGGILYSIINGILNNRVWAIRVFFDQYPLTLFGMSSEGMLFSIDNSYVFALRGYGVIPWCGIMITYCFLIRECIKHNKREELAIICAFLFAGLSEPFLFNSSIKNITVIFIGELLYEKLKDQKVIFQPYAKMNKILNLPDISIRAVSIKAMGICSLILFIIAFTYMSITTSSKITAVYADEYHCDCQGTTVTLPDDIETDKTIIIGEKNPDINYYFFTRENSKLIDVMDIRENISVSIYVAIIVGGIIYIIRDKLGRKKEC